MTFEFLNDCRVFEWILGLWMISLCLNLEILIDFSGLSLIFDFLNYNRVFQWLSSFWMIIEIFDHFREFGRYSSIWMNYEYMIDFRVFEWFSRTPIFLKFIIPPLPPILMPPERVHGKHIFEDLNDFRVFEWFSRFWFSFEFCWII